MTYDTRTASVYFGYKNYRMDLSLTCFEVHSFEQMTKSTKFVRNLLFN